MAIILITLGGGVWRRNSFAYYYLSDIGRKAILQLDSNNHILGQNCYNAQNFTIDFIFKSDPSYSNDNDIYSFVLGFGKSTNTNYGFSGDGYITSNININSSFIDFSQSEYNRFAKYPVNLKDGIYHHYAFTTENNSLHKVYLDGRKILEYTYALQSNITFAICISSNWNNTFPSLCVLNYRVSKGLRWTEDFVGRTPIDDVRWTIKENNDNMYAMKSNK